VYGVGGRQIREEADRQTRAALEAMLKEQQAARSRCQSWLLRTAL
jgi:hypothetical protein